MTSLPSRICIQEFLAFSQQMIPIFSHHLLGDTGQEVFLCSNILGINKGLIVKKEDADINFITLESFFEVVGKIWEQELLYQQEIVQLKDFIFIEFGKLCQKMTDQQLIAYTEEQEAKIIDSIFELAKLDEKHQAEEFCNNLLHGFEKEALTSISKTVDYVFWKPFLTPFSAKLFNLVAEKVEETTLEMSLQKITEITRQILDGVEYVFKLVPISVTKESNAEDLRKLLQSLIEERRICSILIKTHAPALFSILEEYKARCIDEIKIEYDIQNFFNLKFDLIYESLEIKDRVSDFHLKLLDQLPRSLKSLKLHSNVLKDSSIEDLSKIVSQFPVLYELNFNFSWDNTLITNLGIKKFSEHLKKNKYIEALRLDFRWNRIENEGITELGNMLKEMLYIKHFELLMRGNNNKATDIGLFSLCSALKKLTKMTDLSLDFSFGYHSITDHGIKEIAESLKNMNILKRLQLCFCSNYNKITDDGMIALLDVLKEKKRLRNVFFDFRQNKITNKVDSIIHILRSTNPHSKIDINK